VPLRSTEAWFVYDSDGTVSAGAFGAIASLGLGLGLLVTCEIASEKLVETTAMALPRTPIPANTITPPRTAIPAIITSRRDMGIAEPRSIFRWGARRFGAGGRVDVRFVGAGRPVDGGRGLTWDVRRRLDIELHCRTPVRFIGLPPPQSPRCTLAR
jgi:hypothetical protein